MAEIVFLAQVATTLAMVGLIWFVQVVHYPLFVHVGRGQFSGYERAHQARTSQQLGAVEFLTPRTAHYILLAVLWSIAVPLLIHASDRLAARSARKAAYRGIASPQQSLD